VRILQKQKEAQELEVIDLANGLAKDDPSIVVLSDGGGFTAPNPATYNTPAVTYKEQSQHLLVPGGPQPQTMVAGAPPQPYQAAVPQPYQTAAPGQPYPQQYNTAVQYSAPTAPSY